jgi:RNA polymerase sigma-70 factor (ECF subfamily)
MDISKPSETIRCWVDLYSEDLLSWAYHKTFNQQMAEDLVQDTFLSAVQGFHSFQGKSEPKTWLIAILNNKIRDYYRAEKACCS